MNDSLLRNSKKYTSDSMIQFLLSEIPFDVILDNAFFLGNKAKDVREHTHNGFDVHYAVEGSFKIILDNKVFIVEEKQVLVISPNVYHVMYDTNDNGKNISFVFAVNEKEYVKSDLAIKNLINTCLSSRKDFSLFTSSSFCQLFNDIIKEYNNHDCLSKMKMRTLMTEIIIDIMRHMTCDIDRATLKITSQNECDKKYIMDLYFHEKGNDPGASREDLAKRLFITQRHLDRIFKNIYNCTFSEKLISDRIKNAKYLLKHTNISIVDISIGVGFVSHEYFYRCFKRIESKTPGQYRLIKRQGQITLNRVN